MDGVSITYPPDTITEKSELIIESGGNTGPTDVLQTPYGLSKELWESITLSSDSDEDNIDDTSVEDNLYFATLQNLVPRAQAPGPPRSSGAS